ncbi:hypothetical protein [Haloferax sulfurifontis]|uniref:Uncharacterized protein n=2 Tax=Haloferax sulfurifontis TaxID=255616 RepID=M0IMA8_9EURY|nr:hypothetical protein [Haloferax sulfurifontis]ELZ96584.1 hypothetical protein C441_04429 [Haloferax sulfurifontis ATCC BAA-897]GGC72674.1 hypothetical protein GCM10007209_38290 [Haloferax sulfurifontis]
MTDHDRVSVNRNGASLQVYLKKAFTQDTAFPLEAGDDCVAWVADGKLVIAPVDEAAAMDVPAALDPPPDDALPPESRPRRTADAEPTPAHPESNDAD